METMKPSKPPEQKAQSAPESDGIPVFELYLKDSPDLPITDWAGGRGVLRASELRTIVYHPRQQFYRIVERSRDKKVKDIVCYVPREWATYVPMP